MLLHILLGRLLEIRIVVLNMRGDEARISSHILEIALFTAGSTDSVHPECTTEGLYVQRRFRKVCETSIRKSVRS